MRKFKSILLLFIMGMILFPWQMICVTHPFGHDHHEHDGPSPCEIRRQYKGTDPVFWPPMDCEHILSQIDDFQQPQVEKITPTIHTFAILAVFFEFVKFDNSEQAYLFPPEPKCRSATLISVNTLRGPPLV